MTGAPETEPVYFRPDALGAAAQYLREHASPSDEITGAVEIAPVDLPDALLPEVKGRFGRSKRVERPLAQIIYADPAAGPGETTITVDAEGLPVADVVAVAGLAAPAGGRIEATRGGVMVIVDVGDDAEGVVRFATAAMAALVPGWDPRFRASAYDV